ncbi:MAG: trigger factor [Thermodesulfobacteriota bacterium]
MTNIHVEDLSSVKKRVTVEVPEDQVTDMLNAEYRELKRTVQIKGFRRGKVPMNVLRGYFKSKVQADTARKIIEVTFQPGLDDRKITPVAVLSLDPEPVEEGKPYTYTAEIEVPPPVDLKTYMGLKLKKTVREVDDNQVTERLERLRERFASLNPIPDTRGAQEGDHLVVDITVTSEGEPVAALTVSDYHMELGRNFYLPDFDAHLYGLKPEETKEATITLPEDFPRKALAGKTATFNIVVKEAKVRVLPELDDDFAKDVGDFENLDALKKSIWGDLSKMIEDDTIRDLRKQIVDQLVELNPLEVPETMVEAQVDHMLQESYRNLAYQGIDLSRLPPPTPQQREQLKPAATRSVKAGLILEAIAKKESVEISEEEIQSALEKRAEILEVSVDHLKDQMESNNIWEDFLEALTQEKIYKLIEENAEIEEVKPPAEEESEAEKTEKE